MSCPIVWQNNDQTVTVVDIPRSVAAAQGTPKEPCTDVLLSSEPLREPFPSTESKSVSANARLSGNSAHDALREEYHTLLQQALVETRAAHHAQWCFERTFVSQRVRTSGSRSKKRKADGDDIQAGSEEWSRKRTVNGKEDGIDSDQYHTASLPSNLFTSITEPCLNPPDFSVQPQENTSHGDYEPGSSLCNHNTRPATMTLTSHDITTGRSTNYDFRLPATSTFYLGDCSEPEAFHDVVREQQQTFDFILLDPPWPNRSVKRSHKTPGTSYSTISTMDDMRRLLFNLNLPTLMSRDGFVGVWITNKPVIRDLVISLFDACGVCLTEEWIWLKTTAKGEPVTPLEGMWNGRKPYEILLIAKKGASPVSRNARVKRRVLLGVPDLHSRKPCLKEMIQGLLGNEAKVLEVFARYLVSGWWSWGDECIKFNWDGFWRSKVVEQGDGEESPTDMQMVACAAP